MKAGAAYKSDHPAAGQQHQQAAWHENKHQLPPSAVRSAGNYCLQPPAVIGGPHVRSIFMQPGPSTAAPAATDTAAAKLPTLAAGLAQGGNLQGRTSMPSPLGWEQGMSGRAAPPGQSFLRPAGGQSAQEPASGVPQRFALPPPDARLGGSRPAHFGSHSNPVAQTTYRWGGRSEAGTFSAGSCDCAAAASARSGHARGPGQCIRSKTCVSHGPVGARDGVAAATCRLGTAATTAAAAAATAAAATAAAGATAGQRLGVPGLRVQGTARHVKRRVCACCNSGSGRSSCRCRQRRNKAAEHRGGHGPRRHCDPAADAAAGAAGQRFLLGGDSAWRRGGHAGSARKGPLLQRRCAGRDAQVSQMDVYMHRTTSAVRCSCWLRFPGAAACITSPRLRRSGRTGVGILVEIGTTSILIPCCGMTDLC